MFYFTVPAAFIALTLLIACHEYLATTLKDCLVCCQMCTELLKYWLIQSQLGKWLLKWRESSYLASVFSYFATRKGIQPVKSSQRFPWEAHLWRPVEDTTWPPWWWKDGVVKRKKTPVYLLCVFYIVAFAVEGASWCGFHTGMDRTWSATTILSRWFIRPWQVWQANMDRASWSQWLQRWSCSLSLFWLTVIVWVTWPVLKCSVPSYF